jgi:site-specific recombinase XerD
MLLYGTGLRVREILTLRLKDVCLQSMTIRCQEAKGGKTRTVNLPARIAEDLSDHIGRIKAQWVQDSAAGITCPSPEPSLTRKLGARTFSTLPWYWVFPSRAVRGLERWHSTSQGLDKALKTASGQAGIAKRVSPHVFRHSYITSHFLRGADPRTVQVYVGHSRLETTMRYAHAAGRFGLPSPLDLPAPENVLAFPDPPAPAVLPSPSRKHAPR